VAAGPKKLLKHRNRSVAFSIIRCQAIIVSPSTSVAKQRNHTICADSSVDSDKCARREFVRSSPPRRRRFLATRFCSCFSCVCLRVSRYIYIFSSRSSQLVQIKNSLVGRRAKRANERVRSENDDEVPASRAVSFATFQSQLRVVARLRFPVFVSLSRRLFSCPLMYIGERSYYRS